MLKLEMPKTSLPGVKLKTPFFQSLSPDIPRIVEEAAKYHGTGGMIVAGNGGAVNGFLALSRSLYNGQTRVEIINSMEPDLIARVRKRNPKESTLVVVSSTSGTNVGALEMMAAFSDYPTVVITAENDGALRALALKKGLPVLYVPHKTDRFMVRCALAYFPLAVLGLDIGRIDNALSAAYSMFGKPGSPAFALSAYLHSLEQRGYTEVYLPIYSSQLEAFSIYITQLMHESVCKRGKGQTFLVVPAPESQHHSNQRFFGGMRNICGVFLRVESQADKETITQFKDTQIPLREGTVGDISGVPLAKAFEFEFRGTYEDATANGIPCAAITLERVDIENVAELIAFWHYAAVYSSALRGVDPFDQPQVERSKQISFELRKGYAKTLFQPQTI